ncbi:phosphate kinase [Subtercola boreus]|uniref:Phosphate kinase n=1 Tax=Subtercola boreus TaxID=120213 RepID=A0A3E0VNB0_9MICO|nr:PEP/pyruvate-binding domain-containing protein [Subtercola boreus]RFA10377.1 phosphate kinase [Subtercola boreus]TQL56107.1 pyruvate,orthophosphate dikinase [Subtercola boreus]
MTSTSVLEPGRPTREIFSFDHDHGCPGKDLAHLLGGKGAGLAEMTTALGINVPPGFTIALPVCRQYRETGWPDGLDREVEQNIARLGDVLGRRFGDPVDPLLVAVRSGSPISMPGMLDTVLNLGITDETVEGLASVSRDERFAWDSYRRFLQMFGTTVRDLPADSLPAAPAGSDIPSLRQHVRDLNDAIAQQSGNAVPQEPLQQLREAVEAVFRSWDSVRAVAYREHEKIDPDLGTAVNVQAMVFGNRGGISGTGVAFTRDPRTGAATPYGDYLPNAQGEDVVAGSARTLPLDAIADIDSGLHAELVRVLRRLEIHYRDLCDVEFTIENGRLWFLQTRVGKRGALAAARIAVDLVNDSQIALSHDEAVSRVSRELRERARAELHEHDETDAGEDACFGVGLGASGGFATGRAVFSSQAALAANDPVILIRPETSPEDVVGMSVAAGVLTTAGGLVSHAAVVARGWGVPAVVGAHDLKIRDDCLFAPDGRRIGVGSELTIDGASGRIWIGAVVPIPVDAIESPALALLDEWDSHTDADARVEHPQLKAEETR